MKSKLSLIISICMLINCLLGISFISLAADGAYDAPEVSEIRISGETVTITVSGDSAATQTVLSIGEYSDTVNNVNGIAVFNVAASLFSEDEMTTIMVHHPASDDAGASELNTFYYAYDPAFGGVDAEGNILISTEAHFINIGAETTTPGGKYKLLNDLTLSDSFTPFAFAGSFDGNGKTITYNFVDKAAYTVTNNEKLYGYYTGLFTYLYNYDNEETIIENLTVEGTASATGFAGAYYTGGIAGGIGFIAADTTSVKLTAPVTIRNCVNKVDNTVGGRNGGGNRRGGIVGEASSYIDGKLVTIEDCENYGKVYGNDLKGGILGEGGASVFIQRCANYLTSENILGGTSSRIGGIAGEFSGTVSECYNIGEVQGGGYVGGIIGKYTGTKELSDLYNSGKINSTSDNSGGIIGNSINEFTLKNSYNNGECDEGNEIIGTAAKTVNYTNCYYLSDTAEKTDEAKPQPVTTEESKTEAAFEGFDFEKTWIVLNGEIGLQAFVSYKLPEAEVKSVSWAENEGIESYTVTIGLKEEAANFSGYEVTLYDGNKNKIGDTTNLAPDAATYTITESAGLFDKGVVYLEISSCGTLESFKTTVEVPVSVKFAGTDENGNNLITKERHFANIKETPGKYKLVNDLTLSSEFTPFAFAGTFDGNGNTITYNFVDKAAYSVVNSSNKTIGYYTGLFAYLYNNNDEATTVENLTVEGSITTSTFNGGAYYAGGIAGSLGYKDANENVIKLTADVTIRNCVNRVENIAGTIQANGLYRGGIVGDARAYINSQDVTIENCKNYGAVYGARAKGGIVGEAGATVVIKKCANYADITAGSSGDVGGIAATFLGIAAECYNSGKITSGAQSGGIIGQYNGSQILSDLHNEGEIISSNDNAGGIIGYATAKFELKNVYNNGKCTEGKEIVGALNSNATATYTNCYYLSDTATETDSAKPQPVTTEKSKEKATFEGFDFVKTDGNEIIWVMQDTGKIILAFNVDMTPGTLYAPIEISNYDEFAANLPGSDKYYVLTGRIEIPEDYKPVEFSGKLDGQDNVIDFNEYSIAADTSDVGLFSVLSGDIVIENLVLEGQMNVTNETGSSLSNLGALAGSIASNTTGRIENIESNVELKYSRFDYVGGIIGKAGAGGDKLVIIFNNLTNNGLIELANGSSNNVGGIMGIFGMPNSTISNSVNNADIKTANLAGGIVGCSYGNLENCINNGDIIAEDIAGGIISRSVGSFSISNCYNTGDINTTKLIEPAQVRIGGIVGWDSSATGIPTISSCYNVGSVIREGENYTAISGIIGYSDEASKAVIENSFCLSNAGDENANARSLAEFKADAIIAELGEGYEKSTSAAYPFPQLKAIKNDKEMLIVIATAYNGEDISILSLDLDEEQKTNLVGKNAVVIALETEGAEEAGLTVNGKAYQATLTNGKAVMILYNNSAEADASFEAEAYAGEKSVPVSAAYKKVQF